MTRQETEAQPGLPPPSLSLVSKDLEFGECCKAPNFLSFTYFSPSPGTWWLCRAADWLLMWEGGRRGAAEAEVRGILDRLLSSLLVHPWVLMNQ